MSEPRKHEHQEEERAAPPVSPDAVAVPREAGSRALRGPHLYRAVGLAFLLALAYRFFDTLTQVFLLSYAAAIVAVALNALGRRLPLRRKWFAALVGLAVVGSVVALAFFGAPVIMNQARNLAEMAPALQKQVGEWEAWIRETFGVNVKLPASGSAGEAGVSQGGASGGGGGGGKVLGQAVGLLEALLIPVVVFFGALFALAKPNERLLTPLLRTVPTELRPAFYRILQLLGERLVGWLKGTATAMVGVAVLSVAAYSIIGVPNALLLGLFSGLVEFIPLVGPTLGGGTATLVAFVDDPTKGMWTAVAALAIQQVEANVITPWAMSRSAEIHPFVTLFALLLFGGMFGFLGLLLALPLVLLAWTVVQVLWVERAIDTDRDRVAPVVEE